MCINTYNYFRFYFQPIHLGAVVKSGLKTHHELQAKDTTTIQPLRFINSQNDSGDCDKCINIVQQIVNNVSLDDAKRAS